MDSRRIYFLSSASLSTLWEGYKADKESILPRLSFISMSLKLNFKTTQNKHALSNSICKYTQSKEPKGQKMHLLVGI